MNISGSKSAVCAVAGAFGALFFRLFGGWSEDILTLIAFMTVDFIMGIILAGVFGKSQKSDSGALESRAGWKGICKKCVTLLCVLIAHRLDVSLDTDYIRTGVVIAFIANEGISVIENAGLMGIPIPDVIIRAIDILKNKNDKDKE